MADGGNAYQIQDPSAELRALLLAYGISTPPGQFWLTPLVSPVSIVDSRISLTAQSSPAIPEGTNGGAILVNPAAGTRHFDTGPLPAGTYLFHFLVHSGTNGLRMVLRHRDAADAADLEYTEFRVNQASYETSIVLVLQFNERFVCENLSAPGAGINNSGRVWWNELL